MTEQPDQHIADLLGLDLADPEVRDGVADTTTLMDLISTLTAQREAAGLSHADVATAMQASVEQVADFERVGGDPTVALAQRYSRAVGGRLDIGISDVVEQAQPATPDRDGYTFGVYLPPGISEAVRDRLGDQIMDLVAEAVPDAEVVGQAGDPLGAVDGIARP